MVSGDTTLLLRKDGDVFPRTLYALEARILRYWTHKWHVIQTQTLVTSFTGLRKRRWKRITGLTNRGSASTYHLKLETGRRLWVTPEQELMVWPDRWVRADQLDYHTRLVTATDLDDESIRSDRVVDILVEQEADVFTLAGKFTNFVASGVIVRA